MNDGSWRRVTLGTVTIQQARLVVRDMLGPTAQVLNVLGSLPLCPQEANVLQALSLALLEPRPLLDHGLHNRVVVAPPDPVLVGPTLGLHELHRLIALVDGCVDERVDLGAQLSDEVSRGEEFSKRLFELEAL